MDHHDPSIVRLLQQERFEQLRSSRQRADRRSSRTARRTRREV